jgi:hypothetical protein
MKYFPQHIQIPAILQVRIVKNSNASITDGSALYFGRCLSPGAPFHFEMSMLGSRRVAAKANR